LLIEKTLARESLFQILASPAMLDSFSCRSPRFLFVFNDYFRELLVETLCQNVDVFQEISSV
jgi:hypothetical protein